MSKLRLILLSVVCLFLFESEWISAEVAWVKPQDMLSAYRLDVIAKYIYAKHRELGVDSSWALNLYREHLHVWIDFFERDKDGRPYKVGFDNFLFAFNGILDSIKLDGFDSSKTLVPLATNGISNGAHRVASCLLYDKLIAVETVRRSVICRVTADFFKNKTKYVHGGLAPIYLDAMSLQYCELKPSCRMIIIPFVSHGAKKRIEQDLKQFCDVVYSKHVFLTRHGFGNCIDFFSMDLAVRDEWLRFFEKQKRLKKISCLVFLIDLVDYFTKGEGFSFPENELSGYLVKSRQCAPYLSGTHKSAITCAQTFFNQNSINFLNIYDPRSKDWLDGVLALYKLFLQQNDMPLECCCIGWQTASCIFAGECFSKIEIFSHLMGGNTRNIRPNGKAFEVAGLCFKDEKNDDLIFNPANFFYYKNVKIASKNNGYT